MKRPSGEGRTRVAVLDLGSSTATLAVYAQGPSGALARVDRLREPLRLISTLDSLGAFPSEAIERTVETMRRFAHHLRAEGIETVATVATSAVRDATNGADLLSAVHAACGLSLRTLTGEEEARAAGRSATHLLPFRDGGVFDLGGGSLQLARVRRGRVGVTASLPLGSLRLVNQSSEEIRARVAGVLDDLGWWASLEGVVGIGGTVRALARLRIAEVGWPIPHEHGFEMSCSELQALSVPDDLRGSVASAHRSDSLRAGRAVIETLLARSGSPMWVSAFGIREGLVARSPRSVQVAGLRASYPVRGARLAYQQAIRRFDGSGLERADRNGVACAAWVGACGPEATPRLWRSPLNGHTHRDLLLAGRLLGRGEASSELHRVAFGGPFESGCASGLDGAPVQW